MTPASARHHERRFADSLRDTRLLLAFKAGGMGSWDHDLANRSITWLEGTEALFGLPPGQFDGRIDSFQSLILPDDRDLFNRAVERAVTTDDKSFEVEFRVLWPDGSVHWLSARGTTIRDAAGKPAHVIGVALDVTARKQSEQALQESEKRYRQMTETLEERVKQRTAELVRSQEALLQAKHLESIGRLAGGVAHDFNNLLTGIVGILQEVLEQMPAWDERREDLTEALQASHRAMALTKQLLAFGRKQVASPRALNLNQVITDMSRLFRRLLGEKTDIRLGLDPRLGTVRIDQAQLEQILINLLLNARDAMPTGGQVAIETGNIELGQDYARHHPEVQPGPYVQLSVTDNGIGMDADTLRRIFEPFFTTKEVGKGTGMGLATVWGIVKQHGGDVQVSSQPGQGTIFRIYLPRVTAPAEPARIVNWSQVLPHGNETILLVEDEDIVRRVAARALRRVGYDVLEASNGTQAFDILNRRTRPIDLLITDVVMPGMNGRELAEGVAQRQPGVKVLYISGHPYDIMRKENWVDPNVAFLQKSFTPEVLCRRVREVLDQRAPGAKETPLTK